MRSTRIGQLSQKTQLEKFSFATNYSNINPKAREINMKKLLAFVVLGLMWSGNAFAAQFVGKACLKRLGLATLLLF